MTRESLGDQLALLNAILNGTSALFIVFGRFAIARGDRERHRRCMIGAFLASCAFLASYASRVMLTGTHKDPHTGAIHLVYLAVLLTHMLLAVAVVPLVVRTLWLARQGALPAHKKIARVTFPVWLYVSVTGVVVYVMLYQIPV